MILAPPLSFPSLKLPCRAAFSQLAIVKEEPSDLESEAGDVSSVREGDTEGGEGQGEPGDLQDLADHVDVKREAGAVKGLGGGSGLSVLIARQHKFLDSVREVSDLISTHCLADV